MTNPCAPITIGIPAYNRSSELLLLIKSIIATDPPPSELLIIEDKSPERELIKKTVQCLRPDLLDKNIKVVYIENVENLGYDKNIKKIISLANQPWLMLIGNDDLILPNCFRDVMVSVNQCPNIKFFSRSFYRFSDNPFRRLGVSKLSQCDKTFKPNEWSSGIIFRSSGFVGGLVFDVNWAKGLETGKYDGALFYQVYLASNAFCQGGIGYISAPIVEARVDNVPLFGASKNEAKIHTPGQYSARSRAHMWAGVLQIADDVGGAYRIDLVSGIKRELINRQSFHVFEMFSKQPKPAQVSLKEHFKAIGVFNYLIPTFLYTINRLFGKNAYWFYWAVRKVFQ